MSAQHASQPIARTPRARTQDLMSNPPDDNLMTAPTSATNEGPQVDAFTTPVHVLGPFWINKNANNPAEEAVMEAQLVCPVCDHEKVHQQ
mmetsp:Transcript_16211/g.37026  ORF Transcript_16211/g.37026 Transcript_16211/m.37026 type:complete len:90 (+) Transcript_16211:145-414(+)